MDALLNELRKPFHPSVVTWKPGATNQNGDAALGMAYADLRAYQDRLDEICGLNWAVSYTPWGDRIVCHVTVNGITRSSTGEADAQSERNEIAGTSAEAQAFKRACAMFGLGRYLYTLPAIWADYDKAKRQFTDKGKAKLDNVVQAHYKNALLAAPKPPAENRQPAAQPAQPEQPAEEDFGMGEQPAPEPDTPSPDEEMRIRAHEIIDEYSLKTPSQSWAWAVTNHYRTNEYSARTEWQRMITEQFGGASLPPPKIKDAIAAYIELCLLAGKKEPVTA